MADITNMEEVPNYYNEENTMDKVLSTQLLWVVVHIERNLIQIHGVF